MRAVILNKLVQAFEYNVAIDEGLVMANPLNTPVKLPANAAITAIRLKTSVQWASAGGGAFNVIVNGVIINAIVLLNGKVAEADISLNLVTTAYISNVPQFVQVQITGQPYTAGKGIFYVEYSIMPD